MGFSVIASMRMKLLNLNTGAYKVVLCKPGEAMNHSQ